MTKTVLSDYLGDGVQKISLNRPHRLNAIVPELLEDLIAAVDAANRDARVAPSYSPEKAAPSAPATISRNSTRKLRRKRRPGPISSASKTLPARSCWGRGLS